MESANPTMKDNLLNLALYDGVEPQYLALVRLIIQSELHKLIDPTSTVDSNRKSLTDLIHFGQLYLARTSTDI